MNYPIPLEALDDDRLFFGGTAGSGKTYNAMAGVERLLVRKVRVIIPDPLGVWWGLRLDADGNAPSKHNVVIFGGPHGDLPLTENAGALIGETVAGMQESCILDLSQIGSGAAERRFMLAFLSALYKHVNGSPVHVVFDEADMWAPQRVLDKEGDANKLLGMMETLVRRGRIKGFTPWLISQRPAVLNKNVLSQADGIIAFKLTSVQDRDAIGDWVEGQADRGTWRQMYGQLATMERGQGVVWIPGRAVLETAQFPEKRTFDSSRTPRRGEKLSATALRPLDLGALKERLARVETETKANDPRTLKAEVSRLARELAAKPRAEASPEALKSQYETGYRHGQVQARAEVMAVYTGRIREATMLLSTPMPAAEQVVTSPASRPVPARPAAAPRAPLTPAGNQASLPKAERLILTVLAQRQPERVQADRVAAIAGYSAGGGGFNNALGALRSKGYIESGHPLAITSTGLGALGDYDPLPTGPDLLRHWTKRLGKAERSALEAVAELGGEASKSQIAERAGYAVDGGGFNNALGRLRTLGLIEGSGILSLHEYLR